MKSHELKIAPDMFHAVASGAKTAEFRRDDRGYEVGDMLYLTPTGDEAGFLIRRITHIVRGPAYGIPEGFAMLSMARE